MKCEKDIYIKALQLQLPGYQAVNSSIYFTSHLIIFSGEQPRRERASNIKEEEEEKKSFSFFPSWEKLEENNTKRYLHNRVSQLVS